MNDRSPTRIHAAPFEVLRCVAVDHRIGGVLLLDLDPMLLAPLGGWLADAVQAVGGVQPRSVILGSWTSDDDLWAPVMAGVDEVVRAAPPLLAEAPGGPPLIVLIPDLARATDSVHRAAITLVGAGVASGGRVDPDCSWAPRARWLAACSRADAAGLSAHLLDRFAIRCDGKVLGDLLAGSGQRLPAHAEATPSGNERAVFAGVLPPHGIRPGFAVTARFAADALEEVVAVAPPAPGARRDLALARLSRTIAGLRGDDLVQAVHVRAAAHLTGLLTAAEAEQHQGDRAGAEQAPAPQPLSVPVDRPVSPTVLPELNDADDYPHWLDLSEPLLRLLYPVTHGGLHAAGAATPLPAIPVVVESVAAASDSMFPEDTSDLPHPEAMRALRRPPKRNLPSRGVVIGTQPTNRMHDIAPVATLIQALQHRSVRPAGRLIHRSDLRRYRRRPEPSNVLVLVLDHTCRRQWDLTTTLHPYLRWAQETAAAVSVVEFGHANTEHELRATRFRARSAHDPRIDEALSRAAGRASPLAHAIDLAVDELRRFGRRPVPPDDALLVALTDGRGNVPLAASIVGQVEGIVGARGITDAAIAGRPITRLRRVRAIVITPEPHLYPQLAFELADAIGAPVVAPSRAGAEAESSR